jgi:uncharacterized protein
MRMAVLVRQYADLKLGGTDAAVIATAERLGITRVATVDRHHFTVVRPKHVGSFRAVGVASADRLSGTAARHMPRSGHVTWPMRAG